MGWWYFFVARFGCAAGCQLIVDRGPMLKMWWFIYLGEIPDLLHEVMFSLWMETIINYIETAPFFRFIETLMTPWPKHWPRMEVDGLRAADWSGERILHPALRWSKPSNGGEPWRGQRSQRSQGCQGALKRLVFFSPRARWGLLRFDHTSSGSSSFLPSVRPDLNCELQIAVGTAGPQPRAPDLSGHCRTSTASSRSQWALPGYQNMSEYKPWNAMVIWRYLKTV